MEHEQTQINDVQKTLSKLQPGKLPLEIFNEVSRLVVTPVVELIPLRRGADGNLQVWLAKRNDDDPNWPGMLHVPGTVLLATDTQDNFKDALERIRFGKLEGASLGIPLFVETVLCKVRRGTEVAVVYCAEIIDDPKAGRFYNAKSLPSNIVEGQENFINAATRVYSNI